MTLINSLSKSLSTLSNVFKSSDNLLEIPEVEEDSNNIVRLLSEDTKDHDQYIHGVIQKSHMSSDSLELALLSYSLDLLGHKLTNKLNDGNDLIEILESNAIRFRKVNNDSFPLDDAFGVLIVEFKESSSYGVVSNFGGNLKYIDFSSKSKKLIKSPTAIREKINSSTYLIEVYAPLPFKLNSLSDFISFVFQSFTKDLLAIAALTALSNSLQVTFPFLTVYVASNVINIGSIPLALQIGVLAVIFTAISAGVLFIQSQFVIKLEAESDKRAQVGVWDRLLKAKLETIEKYDPVDLSYRVGAISQIKEIVSASNIISILNVVFSIFYLATMFYFLPKAAIAITPIIAIFLITVITKSISGGELLSNSLAAKARLGFVAQQMLDVLPEIKVRGLTDHYLKEWSKYLGDLTRFRNKYRKKDNSIMLLQASFQPLCFLVSFIVIFSDQNFLSANSQNLVALLGYTSALTIFCGQLGSGALTVADSFVEVFAYWNRSSPIIFTDIEPGYGPNTVEAKLSGQMSFNNVSFAYTRKSEPVLNDISFNITPNTLNFLEIARGSGSSTLGNLLMALYYPTSGTISFDGELLHDFNISSFRSQVSLIPQSPYIPMGLMGDLFDTIYTRSDEDLYELLEATSVLEIVDSLRLGLNTPITENASTFSTVERQLLCISTILAKRPKILYFDECMSSLSLEQKFKIFGYVRKYNLTVIVRDSTILSHEYNFDNIISI